MIKSIPFEQSMSTPMTNKDPPCTKRFVRYKEGAMLYSMSQSKFERLAKLAKACYKIDKLVLVNTEIFEQYLESYRLD